MCLLPFHETSRRGLIMSVRGGKCWIEYIIYWKCAWLYLRWTFRVFGAVILKGGFILLFASFIQLLCFNPLFCTWASKDWSRETFHQLWLTPLASHVGSPTGISWPRTSLTLLELGHTSGDVLAESVYFHAACDTWHWFFQIFEPVMMVSLVRCWETAHFFFWTEGQICQWEGRAQWLVHVGILIRFRIKYPSRW